MLDDAMIRRYAEKIYGFAYSKTGNSADAADLSQEILLNLCTADFTDVENPDAFIYTVSRYTWAKFLRKIKSAWDAVTVSGELEDYVDFTDHETPEERVIAQETYDRLRREVMYLSGIRREILILHYYDRLNATEIGERLKMPPSTVRWHLSGIRGDLKERLTMTDEIYRPKKLNVGHYGYWKSSVYAALESDILMQNIVYICRRKPLSVEDISRTLGVAAVYLEDKIADLCSMEYMIETNGKYRTNFFIRDVTFDLAHLRYRMEHTPFVAEEFDRVLNAVWDELIGVGFVGCDLPENDLKWDIYAYFLMRVIGRFDDRMIAELGLEHGAPMRP
ncbi:MAG: RNA polymerase sigma factor, partial [Clostridia bacterium]|nr:RNA polymerase sigma factor [Clostridia bacterium]